MIRIPQHQTDKSLNDIATFIPFIEALCMPIDWEICVEWCTGENAASIEESSEIPWRGSHHDFKSKYAGIFQTIDGKFSINTDKGMILLTAVDSSFWEIESSNESIEKAFKKRYGIYVSPFDRNR
jgi:hypothetical protein